MKYKKGDKVKIRSWISMEDEYGLYIDGDIKIPITFRISMKRRCGKVVTIKKVYSLCYRIKEDLGEWCWTDEMIDHNATRIISIIDRLEMLKRLTSDNNVKIYIDMDINNLKSDKPKFNVADIDFYNNVFRKFKGKSK